MINFRNVAAALAVGFVVAAAASPAMAAKRAVHPGYDARAQAIETGTARVSDRDSIMRACNIKAEGLKQYTWGVQQGYAYRNCMYEHGQTE
jgi:hypothetical protein